MNTRNLNDIIPPSRRKAIGGDEAAFAPPTDTSATPMNPQTPVPPTSNPYTTYQRPRSSPRRRFPLGTALIALAVVAASAGALYAFSGAKVAVTPTQKDSYVSGDFIATLSGGDLSFEVIAVEKIGSNSVPAESTENVNQPAQGTITIMNKQDKPQQLIKNTRFQTPDGMVFRIHDSVSVPAAKDGVAGTLDVTVYADAAGDSYNVPATTFVLPGLAGSATYDLVTAKSSEAMKGGFSGTRPTVSSATRDAEAAKIKSTLASEVEQALSAKVPEGYVLIPGSTATTYETEPDQTGATGTVTVSVKGKAEGVIFPKAALAKAIMYQVDGSYAGQPVTLDGAHSLTLTPKVTGSAIGLQEYPFSLTGNATILWQVDPAKISAAVAGKTRDSAQVVLSGFPEVARATLVLRPFWKSGFPQDPAKITVSVEANGAGN